MDNRHHFDPREERHAKEELPRRVESYRRPWYNQGWIWLIFACIALGVIASMIFGLTDRVAQVSSSIRDQTEELRHQSGLLASVGQGLDRIAMLLGSGIDRIVEAINHLKA